MYESEREIEDHLIANPDEIGFPAASMLRRARMGPDVGGSPDLLVFPRGSSKHKLAIVEVKLQSSREAVDKVIGQLLGYYATALRLESRMWHQLSDYVRRHPARVGVYNKISVQKIYGGPVTYRDMTVGSGALKPEDIQLIIATNGEPGDRLRSIVKVLVHFKVAIRVIRATRQGSYEVAL